ncbi:MAG: conjugative transfer ATPase [Gammaproteobacteria bacterium]|nr:conjugative transfer ATPase [Gammaproteobacteria bacterium]
MLNVQQALKKYFRPFIEKKDIERQQEIFPSFAERLGFEEWSESEKCFLLQDGRSVARVFEVRDVATDSRPQEMINEFHEKITQALSQIIPLEKENPWVLQIFVQEEATLDPLMQRLKNYVPESQKDDSLTQDYLAMMQDHLSYLAQKEGIFKDPLSGVAFRGKTKRIRLVLYRRFSLTKKGAPKPAENLLALNRVSEQLISRLQTLGLLVRTLKGKQCYEWLVRWFNPAPQRFNQDINELLKKRPYPKESERPFGWNMAESIFFNEPKSTSTTWQFDDMHHKVMCLHRLERLPEIGAITKERKQSSTLCYALLDKLPEGSIFSTHIVFEDSDTIEKHLSIIEKSAMGFDREPQLIKADIETARYEMKNGNRLFRVVHAIYYASPTLEGLSSIENQIMNELNLVNLNAILPEYEKNPLDMYLRFLPMNFDYQFEKQRVFRSTYQFATEVAALLPFYGRSRGDGLHPLFTLFNRGGEAFIFDPYHKDFKMANSHMFVVGSTGAGKSVFINTVVLPLLAIKNARVFIIEAGGSFDLLTQYIRSHGKKVTQMTFDRKNPIAINPFSESYEALEKILEEEAFLLQQREVGAEEALIKVIHRHTEKIQEVLDSPVVNAENNSAQKSAEENRDILSEMVMALRNMITGGMPQEEARFTLADLNLISETLVEAIKECKENNVPQVLIQHIVEYFEKKSKTINKEYLARRLDEMARTMKSFTTMPTKSRFFNRPSEALMDSDYMHINLGFLQDTSDANNMVMMSLLMISLLSKILAIAEANQRSTRPTILIIDEAHIPMKNPLVCAFLVLMAKVARKLGLWLIPVTQNVKDFSDNEAKKVLAMMETWLCLALSPDEVDNVEQLRQLTAEQRSLILNVQKHAGLYSEGVLLSSRYQGLFRNIPPRFALAMAMTEQSEKAERQHIMQENNVSELEAAKVVGERLKNITQKTREDEGFDD